MSVKLFLLECPRLLSNDESPPSVDRGSGWQFFSWHAAIERAIQVERQSTAWSVGRLFQGRYKAIQVQKEECLLEPSSYVLLNPVRAEIVKKPECWRRLYAGYKQAPRPTGPAALLTITAGSSTVVNNTEVEAAVLCVLCGF